MNGLQIFVLADDPSRVSQAIRDYVNRVGSQAYMSPTSNKPTPSMEKRTRRTFIISTPENGRIAVWEDGSWADKRLAQKLSEELHTEATWLMVSGATDSWAYFKYGEGKQIGKHISSSGDYLDNARMFAKTNKLPFALFFFEDPNAEDEFEAFISSMKEKKGHESVFDEIELPRKAETQKLGSLKELPSGRPVPKSMRGKVEKFLELIVQTAPK